MSVDDSANPITDEGARNPAENAPQPTGTEPQTPQGATTSFSHPPQEVDTSADIDKAEIERVLASLDAASENNKSEYGSMPQMSPRDKYTSGPMPTIHADGPAALLDGIEREQARKWLMMATGKVLARPFDVKVHYQPNHTRIGLDLINAVSEITGSSIATVASPYRDPKYHGNPTITFLIHNLTQLEVKTLLSQSVWSSKAITFQVAPFSTPRPDFLFTLTNFTTLNEADVHNALLETWNDSVTTAFFDDIVLQTPDHEKQTVTNAILSFIKSTEVRRLDIKQEKSRLDPHFNVYARGQYLTSDTMWYEIKAFLKGRSYKSPECGKGRIKAVNFFCRLCHGCDHPRGLCPFPKIPGWNGGGNRPSGPEENEPTNRASEGGRPPKRQHPSSQQGHYPAPSG